MTKHFLIMKREHPYGKSTFFWQSLVKTCFFLIIFGRFELFKMAQNDNEKVSKFSRNSICKMKNTKFHNKICFIFLAFETTPFEMITNDNIASRCIVWSVSPLYLFSITAYTSGDFGDFLMDNHVARQTRITVLKK